MYHLFSILAAAATAAVQPAAVTTEQIDIHFVPRTPDQMMSFYEARGFPAAMIDILSKQCFITVGIHNKSDDVIWHDLAEWHFSHDGKPLRREHRNYWLGMWKRMSMPQASISTFRWTLIPEQLDYLPDEREGGNIILPRVDGGISVSARFATGADRQGDVITIEYDKLFCAEDEEE